jgi:hypothetical protein
MGKWIHVGSRYPGSMGCLLDVNLVGSENSLVSLSTVQRIGDHCSVLLEVEWSEICSTSQVERLVPVYNKTDVLGLQTFLRDKFARWAGNGSCVEQIRENFKEIVLECIERFVQHKILKNSGS